MHVSVLTRRVHGVDRVYGICIGFRFSAFAGFMSLRLLGCQISRECKRELKDLYKRPLVGGCRVRKPQMLYPKPE